MDQTYISPIGQEKALGGRTQRHATYIIQIQMITTPAEEAAGGRKRIID
jgi:hypothetical protein